MSGLWPNRIDRPGTAEEAWESWLELRYLPADQVIQHAVRALQPGGTLLAVHWRHPVTDYPRSGDDVHKVLASRAGLARLARHQEPDFLAEVYIRTDTTPVSVAQATGLV